MATSTNLNSNPAARALVAPKAQTTQVGGIPGGSTPGTFKTSQSGFAPLNMVKDIIGQINAPAGQQKVGGQTTDLNIPTSAPKSPLEDHITSVVDAQSNTNNTTATTAQQNPQFQVESEFQTAKAASAADHLANPDIPDPYAQYQTLSDYRVAQANIASTNLQNLKDNTLFKNNADVNAFNKSSAQSKSAEAGVTANEAQGREGVTGTGKSQFVTGFTARTDAAIATNKAALDQTMIERDQAIQNAENAKNNGDMKSAEAYQGQIVAAQNKIDGINQKNADLAKTNAETVALLDKSTAAKAENLSTNFSHMNVDSLTGLDATALSKIATSNGLKYADVVTMRDIAVLTAQAAKAKTPEEAASILQNAAKLQTELGFSQSSSKVDAGLTKTMNDGYLYRIGTDGLPERVKDASGNDLKTGTADAVAAKALETTRAAAIKSFLTIREDFVKKGITLNEESGTKFLTELKTSTDPNQVLQDYLHAASANPEVIKAYSKPVKAPKAARASTSTADLEANAAARAKGTAEGKAQAGGKTSTTKASDL